MRTTITLKDYVNININSNVTRETKASAWDGKSYLSGGACILEENRNLYLLNEKSGDKKLLLEGTGYDDWQDRENVESYYFF